MSKINVYIAGPYSGKNRQEVSDNIRVAKKLGQQLMLMDYNVYIPHCHTAHWEEETTIAYDDFLKLHLTFLKDWADILYFIKPSSGANLERKVAEILGIPVVTNIIDLEEVKTKMLSYNRRFVNSAKRREGVDEESIENIYRKGKKILEEEER